MADLEARMALMAEAAIKAAMPGWRSIHEVDRAAIIARLFCDMSEDGQAQVFEAIAKEASTWPGNAQAQWILVGQHLVDCKCSSDAGRQVIRDIVFGMERATDDAALAAAGIKEGE